MTEDPNFAEFSNWLEHHKRRRTTVSGAMAGMAAGAGMGGAKVKVFVALMLMPSRVQIIYFYYKKAYTKCTL